MTAQFPEIRSFTEMLFVTAISSLLERPGRSGLTMLGIVVGVASIFSLLTIGNAAKKTMLNSLDGAEGRSITVTPKLVENRHSQRSFLRPLSEEDLEGLSNIHNVEFVTGRVRGNFPVVSPTTDVNTTITGADGNFLLSQDIVLAEGSNISRLDLDNTHAVAVLGSAITTRLFGNGIPLGETLKIGNVPFKVIGVAKEKTDNLSGMSSVNDFVLIPRTTARKHLIGDSYIVKNKVDVITIIVSEQSSIPDVEIDIERILRRSRGLTFSDPPDFQVFSIGYVREIFSVTLTTLTVLLGALGGISLLVGGVGVMNIMLVTVSERTGEIGLRMALGAKPKQILIQFLIEAIILCLIASAIGVLAGLAISSIVINIGNMVAGYSFGVLILSVGSAFLIGVIFGFWPALRASKLTPVEALRRV